MRDRIRNNLSIKLMSVLLAVVLWLIAVNSSNPPDSKELYVPLTVMNEDSLQAKGIYLKDRSFERSVVITVKGRKEALKNVTESDFEAAIDFLKVEDASEGSLPIVGLKYKGKEDIKYSVSPQSIDISMEKIGENPFDVQIVTSGDLKGGYKIIRESVTPGRISVQGLDSVIKSVAAVKVFVDVKDLNSDLNVKRECKVYNKYGKEITGLSGNFAVDVDIGVAREVPVSPVIRGKPSKNYIVGSVSANPQTVMVTGPAQILDKIDQLRTDMVDIENADRNVDVVRSIVLPNGVKLYNSPASARVGIAINQVLVKGIGIARNNIDVVNAEIDNSRNYDIVTESIIVEVKGDRQALEGLKAADLKPAIDVAGLSEGDYRLPLIIKLPSTMQQAEPYFVDVKISKR